MKALIVIFAIFACQLKALAKEPIRVLLLTDYEDFWHDYGYQAETLKKQLPRYANVELKIIGKTKNDTKAVLKQKNFAQGFDVLIYSACLADTDELELISELFAQIRDKNLPVLFLHCAMHNFRNTSSNPGTIAKLHQAKLKKTWAEKYPGIDFPIWWKVNGVDSTNHAFKQRIDVEKFNYSHPITAHLPDRWYTASDEPYIAKEMRNDLVILYQSQNEFKGSQQPLAWTRYENGSKIFATTLGHDRNTIDHEIFQKLLARAILWLDDKLTEDGSIAEGFEGFAESYENYSSSIVCPSSYILEVEDKYQASRVVKKAYERGDKIKAVSIDRSNSYSPIICPKRGGILLQLKGMKRILSFDKNRGVVRVEPGMKISDLNDYLSKNHGVYLPAMPDFNGVSVAGAIATGSHHSSLTVPALVSDWVDSMTIIDGSGNIKNLSGLQLNAARTHLGVLGIVVEVGLKTRPLEKLRYEAIKITDNGEIAEDIIDTVRSYQYAKASWFPSQKKVIIETFDRVDDDTKGDSKHNLWKAGSGLLTFIGKLPNIILNSSQAAQCTAEILRVKTWAPPIEAIASPKENPVGFAHKIIASDCKKGQCAWDKGLVNRTIEIAMPLEDLSEWMQDVRSIIEKKKACFPILGIYLRFAKRGSNLLGMNSGKDIFMFEIHIPTKPNKDGIEPSSDVYDEIKQLSLGKYAGRPHWAKNSKPTFQMIGQKQYDHWGEFTQIQSELDPKGIFLNDFWESLLTKRDANSDSFFGCVYERDCICRRNSDCGDDLVCSSGLVYKPARVCTSKPF